MMNDILQRPCGQAPLRPGQSPPVVGRQLVQVNENVLYDVALRKPAISQEERVSNHAVRSGEFFSLRAATRRV